MVSVSLWPPSLRYPTYREGEGTWEWSEGNRWSRGSGWGSWEWGTARGVGWWSEEDCEGFGLVRLGWLEVGVGLGGGMEDLWVV